MAELPCWQQKLVIHHIGFRPLEKINEKFKKPINKISEQ
jgi:hypothetical protein